MNHRELDAGDVEVIRAARATTSGGKAAGINTLDDFVKACREARGYFRAGGMVVDITTASAVTALADFLNLPGQEDKKQKLVQRWDAIMNNVEKEKLAKNRRQRAIRFVVDVAWKAVASK